LGADLKTPKEPKKDQENAEKPVSLWGAPLRDVLDALLKTKPMANEKRKKNETTRD
jgi:hypothetical protein